MLTKTFQQIEEGADNIRTFVKDRTGGAVCTAGQLVFRCNKTLSSRPSVGTVPESPGVAGQNDPGNMLLPETSFTFPKLWEGWPLEVPSDESIETPNNRWLRSVCIWSESGPLLRKPYVGRCSRLCCTPASPCWFTTYEPGTPQPLDKSTRLNRGDAADCDSTWFWFCKVENHEEATCHTSETHTKSTAKNIRYRL